MIEYDLPKPRWMQEVTRLANHRSLIFLTGNVKDAVLYPILERSEDGASSVQWTIGSVTDALFEMFAHSIPGYGVVAAYDRVDALRFADVDADDSQSKMRDRYSDMVRSARSSAGRKEAHSESDCDSEAQHRPLFSLPRPEQPADQLGSVLRQMRDCVSDGSTPCVFVLNHVSQLTSGSDIVEEHVRLAFLHLIKASRESVEVPVLLGERRVSLPNLVIVTCDRVSELPPWLYLDNPFSAIVHVEHPSRAERKDYFERYLPRELTDDDVTGRGLDLDELADLTEGLALRDLMALRSVCTEKSNRGVPARRLVDKYRYGDRENLWSSLPWERLSGAEAALERRVMGQPAAVAAAADVLRRSRLHLSDSQGSAKGKPRGVLFFVGPTGVGKTELAKAIAELVFSTEDACIRFDMSEFSQPHSDQRLLGAPPGYVGYEAGGQLTNRVKENPFCVLLFDEIEKAHPSILDKFIQILEDGRMTDGQGETVYFSEAIIVFTSNIGMYFPDPSTGRPMADEHGRARLRVDPRIHTDFSEVEQLFREGVDDYFKGYLGRPEILNRFGQNIITFGFMSPADLRDILERKNLRSIENNVREQWGLEVTFSERVADQIVEVIGEDISMGGRLVGSITEAYLVNPLARALYAEMASAAMHDDMEIKRWLAGRRLHVTSLKATQRDGVELRDIDYEFS